MQLNIRRSYSLLAECPWWEKNVLYPKRAITGHVILKGNYNVHRMNDKLFVLTESSDVRSAG